MKRIAVCIFCFFQLLTVCVSFSLSVDATANTLQAESASFISRSDGVWLWPTETYTINDWAGCNSYDSATECYLCSTYNGTSHTVTCVADHRYPSYGHNGIDIQAAGSKVYAAAPGVLYCSNYDWPSRGITAVVEHPISGTGWSYYSIYQHLQSTVLAKNGSAVAAGEVIAWSGNTDGYGTGQPHLHFGIIMGTSGQGNDMAQAPNSKISAIENCGWITTSGYTTGIILNNPALNSPAGNPADPYGCGQNLILHAGSVMYTLNASEVSIGETSAECEHSYTSTETPASCVHNGVQQYTCSLCGDSYSETIPATGHSYGEWSVDTEASCTQTGTEKKICSTCGETTSQEVPATGHSYSAKQLGAQCGDYPKTRYTCTVCGDSYDEYSDSIYSDWVTELPEGVDPDTVESKTEYRYQTKQTATGTDSTMDGWTFLDTVYGEWGNAQTTTSRPTEGDTLRITSTVQTAWGYYHWCNYYSNCWNVDSIAYGSPNYWHGYASNVELPAISFPDQGGNQAYGGTGTAASPCAYNFYIWFRNPDTDTFSYTYETRELLNRFYKWSDWSAWSEDAIQEDEQTNVETRTLYRYITAEKGEHQYVTVETPPNFVQSGAVTHTCTLCNDVIVDVLPQLEGEVSAWNVSLEDDIHVNFHMNISQSIEDTARVRIYVGEEGYTYLVSDLEKTSDGLYIAGVHIAAAQMSDYIFVTVLNDGCISDTQAYTVRQYADTILADESQSRYHAIVKEMLNYGAAAQDYFDYERNNLANAGITGAGSVQIPDSVDEELSVAGEADGISLYAASLVFRNKIAVRFYFKCDGNINVYTFSANGNACMPQLKDGCFFVEAADILPQNMDQQVELTVTDGNGESMTVSYSPMNYIVRVNEKGSETLKALVKALYNYHLAAKALSAAA